jgi:hypothetical protein
MEHIGIMHDRLYNRLKKFTDSVAADVGMPRFYIEQSAAVDRSSVLFETEPNLLAILTLLQDKENFPGHGLTHVSKVARDAGALVLIDGVDIAKGEQLIRLVFLAHLAGLLHDIKRKEPDHALRGAETAAAMLKTLEIEEIEITSVVQAIANHEAFQSFRVLDHPVDQLLSDALYDSDKFRWGPDNFTETLWAFIKPEQIDIAALMQHIPSGLDATSRIKDTFRSTTGKEYGPDFIDRALEIGRRLYLYCSSIL